jgi:RNA polymerase sigma factor (sigma-70 family)
MGEVEKARFLASHRALALHHARRFIWCGAPLDELYNVAWIGLAKAVEKYNPDKFKNGLTAYAIHWITGELKKFVTRKRTLVTGKRKERGKRPPRVAAIDYFGNVAIGNHSEIQTARDDGKVQTVGEIQTDISLTDPCGGDRDKSDDEECIESRLDDYPDRSLESIPGELERRIRHLSDRERYVIYARLDGRTLKDIGADLGISAQRVRQIEDAIRLPPPGLSELDEYAWKDHEAKLFYFNCMKYCAVGIGHFYRYPGLPPKCHRTLLPYEPPATLVKIITLAPGAYCQEYEARLRSHERTLISNQPPATIDGGQDDWQGWRRKRGQPPKWRVRARDTLKTEHARMFWSGDNLSEYEIWSEPCYASGVPFMVFDRAHQLSRQFDSQGRPRTTWALVGHNHKRRPSKVGEELVLKRKVKTGVIMKEGWRPDPRELKHGCYWKGEIHEEAPQRQICRRFA